MRDDLRKIVEETVDEALNGWRLSYRNWERTREGMIRRAVMKLDERITQQLALVGKHPAWPHMVVVVEDTKRPAAYAKDFYYRDREMLEQRQPLCFAWAVRDTGTHLFIPGVGADACLDGARAVQRTGQEQDWYWWDGDHLEPAGELVILRRLQECEQAMMRGIGG